MKKPANAATGLSVQLERVLHICERRERVRRIVTLKPLLYRRIAERDLDLPVPITVPWPKPKKVPAERCDINAALRFSQYS